MGYYTNMSSCYPDGCPGSPALRPASSLDDDSAAADDSGHLTAMKHQKMPMLKCHYPYVYPQTVLGSSFMAFVGANCNDTALFFPIKKEEFPSPLSEASV